MSPLRSSSPRPRSRGPRAAGGGSLLVNLAATPFVNRRPVERFTMTAWAVGALLASLNVFLWVQYRHDSTELRARLADTRAAIEARSNSLVEMDKELGGLRLDAQNAQVQFLNARIAERTFPWSLLFERIATTLPDGVRLLNLNPVFRGRERGTPSRTSVTAPGEELVDFKLQGVAKSDQELYELIDAFFTSPAFERPRLYQESRTAADVSFTVDVQYRPRWTPSRPDLDAFSESPSVTTTLDDEERSHRPAAAALEEQTEGLDEVDG